MSIDGITLRAISKELRENIIGGKIQKIYQINPHVILMNIYNKKNFKLLISSNPQNSRIHFTEEKYDNPTNATQFAMILRKHIQNGTITNIDQIGLDRSLEIDILSKDELGLDSNKKLMIDIMGKHSNIVLTDKNYKVIEAIKRISHQMSSIRAVYPGTQFIKLEDNKINILENIPNLNSLDIPNNYSVKKLFYMIFQGFGPQIGIEISLKSNINPDSNFYSLSDDEKIKLNNEFQAIANNIKNNNFCNTLYFENEQSTNFYCLKLEQKNNQYKIFDSISKVIDIFYKEHINDNSLNQSKYNLQKIIEQKINQSNNKLINLKNDFKLATKYEKYRIEGDLLSSNSYKISKGLKEITLKNYYDNTDLKIILDEKKTVWDNIQQKYKQSKKLYKSYNLLLENIPKLENEIQYLYEILNQINLVENHSELSEIKDELEIENIIKKQIKKKKIIDNSTPHKFITENENIIYVGKNNKQNEYLTLREANPDDIFFHIKGFAGSHVILKNNHKIQDYEIEIAAYLAAKFSKNYDEKYVDVDYTFKKNVNKAKGSKLGMVYYTDFKTIRVNLNNIPLKFKKIEK